MKSSRCPPPVGYEPSDAHFFVDARSAANQSETAVVTYEGLKLNIIKQGMYAIVKFLGDNEIHDDAGLIETPEEGAEFELYLKKPEATAMRGRLSGIIS